MRFPLFPHYFSFAFISCTHFPAIQPATGFECLGLTQVVLVVCVTVWLRLLRVSASFSNPNPRFKCH